MREIYAVCVVDIRQLFRDYCKLGGAADFGFDVQAMHELDLGFLERTLGKGHCSSLRELLQMLLQTTPSFLVQRSSIAMDQVLQGK